MPRAGLIVLAAASASVAACFFDIGDANEGAGGASSSQGSPSSTSTSAGGAGGGAGGAGASSSSATAGQGGLGAAGGGGGGSGGGGPPTWQSCQAVGFYGACAGVQKDVVLYFYDVPTVIQTSCGTPPETMAHCLVRNCLEEMAGACGDVTCEPNDVPAGKSCVGAPDDASALIHCYAQPGQCIGNVAVKPVGDDADCEFKDCEAGGLVCTGAGDTVDCR